MIALPTPDHTVSLRVRADGEAAMNARPTREELLRLLDYNQETGEIRWCIKVASSTKAAGSIAGYLGSDGYRRIKIAGKEYKAARLIWVMMTGDWPPVTIDHRDCDGPKADWGDRWSNLRLATFFQNGQNRSARSNTGYKGVVWYKPRGNERGRYRAAIGANGVWHRLGYFRTAEEAARVYDKAALRLHGEFARLNFPESAS